MIFSFEAYPTLYSFLSFKILEEKDLFTNSILLAGAILDNTMQISSLDEDGQKGMSSALIRIHCNAIFSIPHLNTFISNR